MRKPENEKSMVEIAAVASIGPKVRKSFSDYVIDIGCWIIDVVVKIVTFAINGIILMVGGAIFFLVKLIFKIALGIVMLFIMCWLIGALLKICWMIWGRRIYNRKKISERLKRGSCSSI